MKNSYDKPIKVKSLHLYQSVRWKKGAPEENFFTTEQLKHKNLNIVLHKDRVYISEGDVMCIIFTTNVKSIVPEAFEEEKVKEEKIKLPKVKEGLSAKLTTETDGKVEGAIN